MSKDVRIHGYFSEPKGVREQNRLGDTALYEYRLSDSSAVVLYFRVNNCMLKVCMVRYEVLHLFCINFIQGYCVNLKYIYAFNLF